MKNSTANTLSNETTSLPDSAGIFVVNEILGRKRDLLDFLDEGQRDYAEEQLDSGSYNSFMYLVPTRNLLHAFYLLSPCLTDEQYWSILNHVWTSNELFYTNRSAWRELLLKESRQSTRHLFNDWNESDKTTMVDGHLVDENGDLADGENKELFDKLPEVVTVFRGSTHKKGKKGFSWTTDREKAVWFAKRFNRDGIGYVVEGTVAKANVIAYFNRRREAEIVTLPEHVTVKQVVCV